MDSIEAWILPFTFIPGVGMLILSTSNRYYHVKELIREIMLEEHKRELWSFDNLIARAHLFHRALVVLYIAIGSFSLSALVSNIHQNWITKYHHICIAVSDMLILSGVVCVVFASVTLIREATISLRHIESEQKPKTQKKES